MKDNYDDRNPATALRRKIKAAIKLAQREGRLNSRQFQLWLSEMENHLDALVARSEQRDETLFDEASRVY